MYNARTSNTRKIKLLLYYSECCVRIIPNRLHSTWLGDEYYLYQTHGVIYFILYRYDMQVSRRFAIRRIQLLCYVIISNAYVQYTWSVFYCCRVFFFFYCIVIHASCDRGPFKTFGKQSPGARCLLHGLERWRGPIVTHKRVRRGRDYRHNNDITTITVVITARYV